MASWTPLSCPSGQIGSSSCSYTNSNVVDLSVAFFFQTYDSPGVATSFSCVRTPSEFSSRPRSGEKIPLCARAWGGSSDGSAASCFFLLAAGEGYQCSGSGKVTVIGAHGALLKGKNFDPSSEFVSLAATFPLGAPSKRGASFSYSPTSTSSAQWLQLTHSSVANSAGAFECSIASKGQRDQNARATAISTPCAFARVNNTDVETSSCAFLLSPLSTLNCSVSKGLVEFKTAHARDLNSNPFSVSLATAAAAASISKARNTAEAVCPPASPTPTDCDCSFTNTQTTDVAVSLSPLAKDSGFDSFHCFIGGANVCAWGTGNSDEDGNGGSCWFLLPPGATYACTMQWGAVAFVKSSHTRLNTTLFGTFPQPSLPSPSQHSLVRSAQPLGAISSSHLPKRSAGSVATERVLFDRWRATHNKTYTGKAEEAARFNFFRHHLSLRNAFFSSSSSSASSPLAVPNSLADLSPKEFAARKQCHGVTGSLHAQAHLSNLLSRGPELSTEQLPDSVDWRSKGAVTPIKDQGQCGSCWSFSTTGAIEGAWNISGQPLQSLSEQTLVSCDASNYACNGGWPYLAMEYVAENGINTEAGYPYTAGQGSVAACEADQRPKARVKVDSYALVPQSEDQIMSWVAHVGPVSVSLDAMTQLWWPYTGGVMTGCCNKDVDHAVLVVGYGATNEGQKYWIIKNSWGSGWGEQGYVRLERGSNQCDITSSPVVPLVPNSPPLPPSPVSPTSPTLPPSPTPPPSPPSPPTPASPTCPADATLTQSSSGLFKCKWEDGIKGLSIPPNAEEYCQYFTSGHYFGYSWPTSTGSSAGVEQYAGRGGRGGGGGAQGNCGDMARFSGGGQDSYCVYTATGNAPGSLNLPSTATVDCKGMPKSFFVEWTA